VAPSDFDRERVPAHLFVRLSIEDSDGREVAAGRDLTDLARRLGSQVRAAVAGTTTGIERRGLLTWELGTLPRAVDTTAGGQPVRGYPALVDEGETAGVRVLASEADQARAMAAGTRRLLLLAVPGARKEAERRLRTIPALAAVPARYPGVAALADDSVAAAADRIVSAEGGPAWDEAGFARLRELVAGRLVDRCAAIVADVVAVLDAAREVERLLDALTAIPLQPARADVREQLRRLVHPGFVSAAGAARLPDIERYLRAAARRLERLPNAVAVDRDRMNAIHELERAYRERLRSSPSPAIAREVPWMLEELRVHHFAQNLARGGVSAKKIRRALAV